MNEFVILIPAYKPDELLSGVVENLKSAGFSRFVIIDDGCPDEYAHLFDALRDKPGVAVLRHEVNRGKGAGLKTGLRYIAETMSDCKSVLTVDADGQHLAEDVLKVANAAKEAPGTMILGSRNFSLPQVPARSRFGNRLTSLMFRVVCHAKIGDTQTGLRAIPFDHIDALCEISGERYEYETNVLLHLKTLGIPLKEVEIRTVYLEQNESSHFNPIVDSIRIYRLIFRFWAKSLVRLLKFSASSILCAAVDYGLFYVLHLLFASGFGALAEAICQGGARVCSSVLNFTLNKTLVFGKREGNVARMLARYYLLAVVQLIVSVLLLSALTQLTGATQSHIVTLLKACVDIPLYLLSYRIQFYWVFGKESTDGK